MGHKKVQKIVEDTKWKYSIGSGKMPMILTFIMFVLFGGLAIWLHKIQNGAFIFAGMLAAVILILFMATVYRFLFYKVFIGKEGFYYQTGIKSGTYYVYENVEKAWISSGTAQHGAQEEYCIIEITGRPIIRFQFFYNDKKGVKYLIKQVEACRNRNDNNTSESEEYLIDGKAFGKERIVIALILTVIIAVLDISLIQSNVPIYLGDDSCPYCTNRRALPGYNSFAIKHAELLEEWDYINNYLICNPDTILDNNNINVWWICKDCNKRYSLSVKKKLYYNKRHMKSCTYCKGLRRKKKYFF